MTPSSPSYPGHAPIRRRAVRPLGTAGTLLFAILLVLLVYFVGREVLLNGHALFRGGR
jgi:hypothetical protein